MHSLSRLDSSEAEKQIKENNYFEHEYGGGGSGDSMDVGVLVGMCVRRKG